MGRNRPPCVACHLLRVRLNERALCLRDYASEARFRLATIGTIVGWRGLPQVCGGKCRRGILRSVA
jgi:hypothetical protein